MNYLPLIHWKVSLVYDLVKIPPGFKLERDERKSYLVNFVLKKKF